MTKNNKRNYYSGKIQYSLQKIDYSLARMNNKKPDNLLSKIYFVMDNYNEIDYLTLTRVFKDIPESKIRKAVKYLSDLGVLSWEGKRLLNDKMVRVEKKDFATFVRDIEAKMKKSKGKNRLNLKEIQDVFQQAEEETEPIQVPKKEEKEHKVKVNVEEEEDEWVEIKYSKDVIIKTKKSKVKKLLE